MQQNLTLRLNCSCLDAQMDGKHICSVTGWQTTTQQYHKVYADIFADCSGDSVLAPLTGATYRMGRESCEEYSEDIAPQQADRKTMGLSCLMQVRETDHPVSFTPPRWANHYTKQDFEHRIDFSNPQKWTQDNFWWMEIGGTSDTICDTEQLRDELIKMAYGVWDFIKNSGELPSQNWDLEWIGFLPGKRESGRYQGDYMLRQEDLRTGKISEDAIAYDGWTMDNHEPEGFYSKNPPTKWNPVHSPYTIPYRCIYSENIENLMFAGRNISATHVANSSTRVMATCGLLGHAVGNAAAIAVQNHILPRQLLDGYLPQLQQSLLKDDIFLPGKKKELPSVMKTVHITADGCDTSVLLDGEERGEQHLWVGELCREVIVTLDKAQPVQTLRMVLDSDLNRTSWQSQKWYVKCYPMVCNRFLNDQPVTVPATLLKEFSVYVDEGDGLWKFLYNEDNNYQRLVNIPINRNVKAVKLLPTGTWGAKNARIFSIELE